jgi:hypothetical protein
MLKPSFAQIWKRIVAYENEEFKTTTNLPFTYEINGTDLFPIGTKIKILKADFAKAYEYVPIKSPSVISKLVKGSDYIWAIFHDERISKKEW